STTISRASISAWTRPEEPTVTRPLDRRTLPCTSPSITRSESPKTSPVIFSPELILDALGLTGAAATGSTAGDLKTRGSGGGGAAAGGSATMGAALTGAALTGAATGDLDSCETGFSSGLRHIDISP